MVQFEPSPADGLIKPLEAFAQGLEKYMKPDHDFQIAMQKAVGSNPALAQQLADLEYNAPGSLGKMGFGNLGKVIGSIPESEKSQFMRTSRGEILAQDKQKLELESAETGVSLDSINDLIHFLKDPANRAIRAEVPLKILLGQTLGERALTAANVKQTETEIARAEAEMPASEAKGAAGRIALKAYEDTIKNAPSLKGTDFIGLARDFLGGRADGATMASLFNTPGAQEVMSKAIASVEEERQIALRESIAAMHGSDSEEALLTREAFARYQATKGSGTLDAWKIVIGQPKKVEEIKAKKPGDRTQEDRDVLQASRAQDSMQDNQRVSEVRNLNTGIRNALRDIEVADAKGASPSDMETYVANLNNILTQKADATGQVIIAKYGDRPNIGESEHTTTGTWWEGKGLYYVDSEGKRVEDSKVFAEPKVGLAGLSANAFKAYTDIMSAPLAQRAIGLENLKQTSLKIGDLSVYNEVKARMEAKP